jgi:hypothetical protein
MTASVAGQIAEIWTDPFAASGVARDAAVDFLGMSPERFASLLGEVAAATPGVISDLDINIGSEEIANQLLDQTQEAGIVGERLLAAIASSPQLTDTNKEIRVTVSIGCATRSRLHSFNDSK